MNLSLFFCGLSSALLTHGSGVVLLCGVPVLLPCSFVLLFFGSSFSFSFLVRHGAGTVLQVIEIDPAAYVFKKERYNFPYGYVS